GGRAGRAGGDPWAGNRGVGGGGGLWDRSADTRRRRSGRFDAALRVRVVGNLQFDIRDRGPPQRAGSPPDDSRRSSPRISSLASGKRSEASRRAETHWKPEPAAGSAAGSAVGQG